MTATAQESRESLVAARKRQNHPKDDGADDDHVEAADGDDMRCAYAREIFRQFGRNATFVAGQDTRQQAGLRVWQRLADVALYALPQFDEQRLNRVAMPGANDFQGGIGHAAEDAAAHQVFGIREGVPAGWHPQPACRADAVAKSNFGAAAGFHEHEAAGGLASVVYEDALRVDAQQYAVIAKIWLGSHDAGDCAGAAIVRGDFAAGRD